MLQHFKLKIIELLITLCCLCSIENLSANENATKLKLYLKDGTTPTYMLDNSAKITFENTIMYFSSGIWKFEIPLNDLSKWTYESTSVSIDNPNYNDIAISQFGNIITVWGVEKNTNIRVYTNDGKLLLNLKSIAEKQDIRTDGWNSGVYLINVGKLTFKIIKR